MSTPQVKERFSKIYYRIGLKHGLAGAERSGCPLIRSPATDISKGIRWQRTAGLPLETIAARFDIRGRTTTPNLSNDYDTRKT